MEEATGEEWRHQTVYGQLEELAERGLIDRQKRGNAKLHVVTGEGWELLEDDLLWLNELVLHSSRM